MPVALKEGDPARVGPYRLHGRLGGGGMGQVFLGRSPGGLAVAVKLVRPELAEDEGFRRRFAREVAAARKVGGFYTAQVVQADVDAERPWVASAYIAGPSLQDAVAAHGPLPPEAAAMLGAGLAEGLSAVHANGLVHRDLKPDNVVLAKDGPRVIDFGIARALEDTTITRRRGAVGTPPFMSPEQARGLPVGYASDVFSLGGVLCFTATGRAPFGVGAAEAVVYRVVHEEPDLDGVPHRIAGIIGECLRKDPGARPKIGALLETLSAAAGEGNEGGWAVRLPEKVAEEVARRETLLITAPAGPRETRRNEEEPKVGESGAEGAGKEPPRSSEPRKGTLELGNLGLEEIGVVIDGGTVARLAPGERTKIPVPKGKRSVQARSRSHSGVRKVVRVRRGRTERVAFDGTDGRADTAPEWVDTADFPVKRFGPFTLRELQRNLRLSLVFAVAMTMVGLGGVGLAALDEEFDPEFPEVVLQVAALGLAAGALVFAWCTSEMVFSRKAGQSLAIGPDGLSTASSGGGEKPLVRWSDLDQVSVLGHGESAQIVVWPREGSPRPDGAAFQGGVIILGIEHLGRTGIRDHERLKSALAWFGGDVYVDQND